MQAMRSSQGSLKPIFISVGHRISLATAIEIVRMVCRFRVPEPIRQVSVGIFPRSLLVISDFCLLNLLVLVVMALLLLVMFIYNSELNSVG